MWVVAPLCVGLHPEGGWVERAPFEDFVGQQAAGLPVLVTQQRVDKRVACCLAVGQAFGQYAPVRAYGHRREELCNSIPKREQTITSHSTVGEKTAVVEPVFWATHLKQITLPQHCNIECHPFTSLKCHACVWECVLMSDKSFLMLLDFVLIRTVLQWICCLTLNLSEEMRVTMRKRPSGTLVYG